MRKKEYNRAIKIIITLNEQMVEGGDGDDSLWDELGALRKKLDGDTQEQVIARLIQSLFVRTKVLELDEATPGSKMI